MNTLLDDHPALAAAIRGLLSSGITPGAAADWAARVASETRSIPVSGMDAWERAIRVDMQVAEYATATAVAAWKVWARPRRFTSWLDLCSHDGRRREAALRVTVGGAPNAFLLALALRRLNDWVPEVRRAARETLPDMASNSAPDDVAHVLWNLFAHWSTWGRMEPADRDAVVAMAAIEPVSQALRSKIMGATAGPAAFVLSQCARSNAFDGWLKEFAQGALQPAVRVRALRWLFFGRVTWVVGHQWRWTDLAYCKGKLEPVFESRDLAAKEPFRVTHGVAMADRSTLVRRVAAEFLIRELPALGDDALALAQRTAGDPSPSVAALGAFALKQLKHEAPAAPTDGA